MENLHDVKVQCLCGKVEAVAEGPPLDKMRFLCHCSLCQQYHSGPFAHILGWPWGKVKVVKGAEHMGTYAATPRVIRQFCKHCSSPVVMHELPSFGRPPMQVLFAGTLGRDDKTKKLLYQGDEQVEPVGHVFYKDHIIDMDFDGRPKWSSFPPWMQQSGDRQPKNHEDLL